MGAPRFRLPFGQHLKNPGKRTEYARVRGVEFFILSAAIDLGLPRMLMVSFEHRK